MHLLETPEARFRDLVDFPYEPHYAVVDPTGARMHYVDEGPRDGAVVLLLHGEPSWSYLYRHMIPPLVEAGHRVIAPDLLGFGRSSKPATRADHSYARHVSWVATLVRDLDLQDITFFGQDWGSLIGLRVAAEHADRYARIVIGNGFLPKGELPKPNPKALAGTAAFLAWRTYARLSPRFVISRILNVGCARSLTKDERRAYDAPFPDRRFLAGPRALPLLVPIWPWDPARPANLAAWEVFEQWHKPFLTTFSTGDPLTRGLDGPLQRKIPGAAGLPHRRVRGGHFLQEDAGPELASAITELIATT